MANGTPAKIGVRSTRQRKAILEVLDDLDAFASAKTIYQTLLDRNRHVGLTTVYRTLQSLVDVRAIDVLHMASGESLYRSCTSDIHHHHLVCIECGKTVEIIGDPVETWARRAAAEAGFKLTSHTAEVFGVCPACQVRPPQHRTPIHPESPFPNFER